MESVSRYVEFSTANCGVYSIELAHLLFAASSEVDVVAKLLCQSLDPTAPRDNIRDYRQVLNAHLPDLKCTKVFIPRFGMDFIPWDNWGATPPRNPDWWTSYNNVKHNRDTFFQEATLKNALNALGGLLTLTFHHYRLSLSSTPGRTLSPKETTAKLQPESTLLRLEDSWYHFHVVG